MKFRVLLLCVVVTLSSAFSVNAAARNFRWASAGDITTQDPHGQDETLTKSFNQLIYERLFQPGKEPDKTCDHPA